MISERSQSLKSIDGTEKPHVSLKDELKILEKFDLIILIKDDDLSKVSENFDSNRLVLAPHPVDFPKRNIRDQPRIVGFIGSRYGPNISSMNDFIQDVWPSVQDLGMQLNIYGDVGVSIDPPTDQTVNIRGFVESDDTIYDEIDIVVNPVQQGAGFKIKTIEALGNGLPLISTRHSVMGLPEEKEEYYLMAENAEDFQKHLRRLHGSIDERIRLGDEAYRVASNHFSPKACFTQLLQCLNRR